jgi:hypothetical protein
VYALSKGLYAIGALALLGALLAWTLVRPSAPTRETAADASAAVPPLAEPARDLAA